MIRMLRHQLAPLAAFLVLSLGALAYAKASDDRDARIMRNAQVESCERVNVLRAVVQDFIGTAAEARRASGDRDVARKYERQLEALMSVEHVVPGSAVVDCEEAFPEP